MLLLLVTFNAVLVSATDPDCLAYATNGAVTTLADDQSSGDTFVQIVAIEAGATCRIRHTEGAKIIYSSPVTA